MLSVNHDWQINKYTYKEIANPIGVFGDFFHLIKNKIEYRIPISCIIYLVPKNKYFIKIKLVNRLMKRVENNGKYN